MKKNANQLSLVSVSDDPIPGTTLYRRREGDREISPLYRGNAQNELEAIEQAQNAGLKSVTYGDTLYVFQLGNWYCWSFPWK